MKSLRNPCYNFGREVNIFTEEEAEAHRGLLRSDSCSQPLGGPVEAHSGLPTIPHSLQLPHPHANDPRSRATLILSHVLMTA